MASLVTNATRIAASKENIRQSIINKGVEVAEDVKIEDYPSKIDLIRQGIEEGTYNIEIYVRVDNELIGEGIEFNLVGTDGNTIAATSRAGGYVFLTLNYGVGYDMQPEEQNKYYAENHPLVYHLKDEGDYFATDYFFTTVQASGDDFEIKNCDYIFYRYGNDGGMWNEFDNIITKIKQPTSAKYMLGQDSNGLSYWYVPLDKAQKILNLDFSKCVNAMSFMRMFAINDSNATLTGNLNFSSCTNFQYAFSNWNYGYRVENLMLNIVLDFNGTTGKVTNFNYAFENATTDYTTMQILNLNMDRATSLNNILLSSSSNYMHSLYKLTFKGTFGGLSTSNSLTFDLSRCMLDIEGFRETITTLSPNKSGKTRIFKLSTDLYNNLTEDLLLLAAEKDYELSA